MFVLFGTLSVVSLSILWMGYACLLRKVRAEYPEPSSFVPLTILKPLKGVEAGLYENLSAVARLEYPDFEIIFGAEEADDPALEIARRVQREHPNVPIRILVGGHFRGLNPKVRLLRRLAPEAKDEWILISDSNVRPSPDYLKKLRACQEKENAAMVHSLLVSHGDGSLAVRLENLHMNAWVAASIALCDAGEHPCVIGKSMLLRRADLERVGGFASVEDILAEDYILGAKFTALGLKVSLSSLALPVMSGGRDLGSFFNRHVRWGQLRRRISPHFFVGELLVNPTPFLLGSLIVAPEGFWIFGATGLVLKWMSDLFLYRHYAFLPGPRALWLLPLKDLLVPVLWLLSALRTRVNWRGNEMYIGPGSRLSPVAPAARAGEGAEPASGMAPLAEWP